MNVEFSLSIQENNETLVMEKALKIAKLIKQVGFKIDKLEVGSEIEHLMGEFNRAEALSSRMQAIAAATMAGVISKIG